MKAIRQVIIGAVALLFISAIHTFAIEGIQLSVQSSNVVLSWPSVDDGSETYIIQYRPTLNSTDSWTTLTDFYPAAMDTNMTSFVHSNIVQYPAGMDSDAGGNIQPSGMSSGQSMLMVKPANDSGNAVPLAIYPPGFDLTGFDIFDSASGELMKGDGYSVRPAASPAGGAQPMDYSPGDDDTNPYTGFYRVVRDGVHIWGLTNGMVLSGEVQLPIEFAVGSTDAIVGITFYDENDNPLIGAAAYSNGTGGWILDWNTPMSFNGDYDIYAELDFASDDPVISTSVTVWPCLDLVDRSHVIV